MASDQRFTCFGAGCLAVFLEFDGGIVGRRRLGVNFVGVLCRKLP